ncbi:MAG: TatD family hydrolase [Shewanella sp.]
MIDSHAHLDFSEFDSDRKALFLSMKQAGIETAILPGVSPKHWDKQLIVSQAYSCPYGLGIHPWYCDNNPQKSIVKLRCYIEKYKHDVNLVALGECGLDKRHKHTWDAQWVLLEAQLVLAKNYQLPVILHVVKAHNEMLSLLNKHTLPKVGVIHGFYGSVEIASEYIKLGYKLGIGGLILNANAQKLKQCVAQLPLDAILIETDSPAMSPRNIAKTRNTPLALQLIIAEIASLHKKSRALISEHMFRNVVQLFDLKLF